MSEQTTSKQILRLADVIAKTGICKTAIYQKIKENTFPKSIKLGAKSVGWVESEIDQWINQRISERG